MNDSGEENEDKGGGGGDGGGGSSGVSGGISDGGSGEGGSVVCCDDEVFVGVVNGDGGSSHVGNVSDGGGVTWAYSVGGSDALGLSSASMNINMGGIATLAYDSGTGGYGANAVDNIVPTAWEEIDYGLSTGITDLGAVSASKGVINLAIKAPTAGTGISLSYTN